MYLFLPRTLCALKRIVARDQHHRFGATTGVLIESLGDSLYTVTATDGTRLLSVQGMVKDKTPYWNGLVAANDDAQSVIVNVADIEKAFKLGDESLKTFGVIGLATKGDSVYLGVGDDCLNVRAVGGRFPNWRLVMPKDQPLYAVRLDPKMVAETLLALHEMGFTGVDLFYYGDGKTLGLRAVSEDHLVEGVIVPLVLRPEKAIPETPTPSEPRPEQDQEEEPEEDDPEYLERLHQAIVIANPELSAENLRDAYDNITDCIDYLTELGVTIPEREPSDEVAFQEDQGFTEDDHPQSIPMTPKKKGRKKTQCE